MRGSVPVERDAKHAAHAAHASDPWVLDVYFEMTVFPRGNDELARSGAYRVYQDPADLLEHLDEVGVRVTD